MRSFFAAWRFLTILPAPAPRDWGTGARDLERSVPWFPIVGLLLGVVAGALAWALDRVAPPMLASALLVAAMAAFSGALHLDGLSDTADGFLSSRPRERVLEIMRDSHIGAMGVIAIVVVLLVKFAAIHSIPVPSLLSLPFLDSPRTPASWRVVLLMPLAGRVAMVVQMALLPYVRTSGLGAVFNAPGRPTWSAVLSLAILFAVAIAAVGWCGLAIASTTLVGSVLFSGYCRARIGGATGDTYGATCELMELAPPIVAALWPRPAIVLPF